MAIICESITEYEKIANSKEWNNNYLFRGHSCENFKLLPKAYRIDSNFITNPEAEIFCIYDFILDIQRRGYDFSDNGILNIFNTNSNYFPTDDMRKYMALAQHYAFDSKYHWIKTSLLDVTYNIDIAAYFAVSDKQYDSENANIIVISKSKVLTPYKIYEPHEGS